MTRKFLIMNVVFVMIFTFCLEGLHAVRIHKKIPLQIDTNYEGSQNIKVDFLGVSDEIPEQMSYTALPQVVVACDPENPSEVVLVDVRRAILKLIADNPELVEKAGITSEDYVRAGITEADLAKLRQDQSGFVGFEENIEFVMKAFFNGGVGDGAMSFIDGGGDLMKACGKMSLGMAILMKKAIIGIIGLVCFGWNEL
jgi:hypothetical protein